jgi:hypothetical protein
MAGVTMGIKLHPIVCFPQPMDKAQEELEAPSKVTRRIQNEREREKLVRFGLSQSVEMEKKIEAE